MDRGRQRRIVGPVRYKGWMTINVAFKTPEALVFASDGLGTLIEVDAHGTESIASSMPEVEKLVLMSSASAPVLATFNGVGSLGAGSVAAELRAYDGAHPRAAEEGMAAYAGRVAAHLRGRAQAQLGALPRPFHLIVGGFDRGPQRLPPRVYSIQWSCSHKAQGPEELPAPVLHSEAGDCWEVHRYGAYYAGLTEPLDNFVSGFAAPVRDALVGVLLGGMGPAHEVAAPGLLESLVYEARRLQPAPAEVGQGAEVRALAESFALRIVQAMPTQALAPLAEHFSLQAAINYCVFLAQCAWAKENWSPARSGPPRVGSTLQVAYLTAEGPAVQVCGLRPGVDCAGVGGAHSGGPRA